MKKGFDCRRLYPICYYRHKKNYDFNAFIFYVDTLIQAFVLAGIITTVIVLL
jgi:hypothetical protein